MYVLNNANCVTIVELQSISEHEREKLNGSNYNEYNLMNKCWITYKLIV
jgi:hypothetical protein